MIYLRFKSYPVKENHCQTGKYEKHPFAIKTAFFLNLQTGCWAAFVIDEIVSCAKYFMMNEKSLLTF